MERRIESEWYPTPGHLPFPSARRELRKKLLLFTLAAGSAACLFAVGSRVYAPLFVRWHVARLESEDRAAFTRSFAALAYDPDPRVSEILCDLLEKHPSRETRYQIVRILYTRCQVHYAPENVALPSSDELRRLVRGQAARAPEDAPVR